MKIFQHGGDVIGFAKSCKCSVEEVIDLSSNINFVKPTIDIDFNSLDISAYPNYDKLYEEIAKHYDVTIDEIELFNGGSSAIFSFFRLLKTRYNRCTIYSPAYLEYKKSAKTFGYELDIVDRFDNINKNIANNSLVIFVNPSTPDGMLYDIDELLEIWHKQNSTVLVDESFIEFSQTSSITSKLSRYPNLYILKSMTKFFGSAGIRMGTIISQANNIKLLKKSEPLWKISEFDSNYIQAVLKDREFKKHSDSLNDKSKRYLMQILKSSPLVEKIYPSFANYILVKLNISAKELQKKLLSYKIMIRSCENFDGLTIYHARIAVKSMQDLEIFKKALNA